MKVCFLGPLGRVTGSCTWLRDDAKGWNFLVDCGLRQGDPDADAWNRGAWPFNPADIKFVVLTHAHIDHSGLIPRLYRDGFKGTVYATAETTAIAKILLTDSAHQGNVPYGASDVGRIHWHEPGKPPLLGGYHPVDTDLFLQMLRSGHVVGGVSVAVVWGPAGAGQKRITFSGDLGPDGEDREQLPYLRHRMNPKPGEFAVVEATYGALVRDPLAASGNARREKLGSLLDAAIESGGVLLLPCFALGRTQDIQFDLHWLLATSPEKYARLPIFLDAPMAAGIHKVLVRALERTESNGANGKVRPVWLGKQWFRWFGLDDKNPEHIRRALTLVRMTLGLAVAPGKGDVPLGNDLDASWRSVLRVIDPAARQALIAAPQGPGVIVTSGGMCDGGPVVQYMQKWLGDSRTIVALTGYASPATVAGQLQAIAHANKTERARHTGKVRWPSGFTLPISGILAQVETLPGYSAHADQAGLLDWLFWEYRGVKSVAGQVIFLQHGDDGPRRALAEAIRAAAPGRSPEGVNVSVVLPDDPGTWYDLEAGGASVMAAERQRSLEKDIERMQRELDALKKAA
jgi:metallo-beta-lactamase family protein